MYLGHELILSNPSKHPCHPLCHSPWGQLCFVLQYGPLQTLLRFAVPHWQPGRGAGRSSCSRGTLSFLFLLVLEAPGCFTAAAGVAMIPIPVLRRQGEAAALVSCLHGTGVGSFGDLLVVTQAVTSPGVFLRVGSPVESSSATDLLVERDAGDSPLTSYSIPAVLDLAPAVRLGFGKLGWALVPGIFHLHPNDFW